MNYYRVAFTCLLSKEIRRFIRIWPQTLLPAAITTILYFLVFGRVMGDKIGTIAGLGYSTFIAPGLIMLAVITNSYSNVVGSFYSARYARSIEEILVSPMPNWLIIISYTCGGIARGLMTGMIVMLISLFFAHYRVSHLFLSFILIILCSFLFSLAGLINGIFARSFDDLVVVPTFILTPLIYLGGVFFSTESLSVFWQYVSFFNPLHYLIDSFRYALLGVKPLEPIWLAISGVILLAVALFMVIHYFMASGKRLKT